MFHARPSVVPVLLVLILAAAAAKSAPEPEAVSFRASDGMRIAADYYAPKNSADQPAAFAILLHMYRSDRTAWTPLVQPLHDAGFAILALDLRGHGESATTETRKAVEARETSVFLDMQHDVRGAYDWLARRAEIDRSRFVIVGASVGCSVALQYAASDCSVDAVVCLSPGLKYLGLDSAGDIHQVTGRKILMWATEDERDAPYTLKQRGEGVEVRIHKGHKAHGTRMFGVVPRLERQIATYLQKVVGHPSGRMVYGSIKSHIYHLPDSGWIDRISSSNLRYYSSPEEAEARGLRASRSKRPPRAKHGERPHD